MTKTAPRLSSVPKALGFRVIAIYMAAKGLLVVAAGSGALLLLHRDVQRLAERVVAYFDLDPASRYPRAFLYMATHATPAHLRLVALGALLYAMLQCVEAFGLWKERRWAEWLAVFTGLIYVPFEALAYERSPGWEPLLALATNLAIVLFLAIQLRSVRRWKVPEGEPTPPPLDRRHTRAA